MSEENSQSPTVCPGCSCDLQVPYIQCAECRQPPLHLCLHCFARGLEMTPHENNHKYTVVKNDFPLFEKDWTAHEEQKLLDVLSECGVGNWEDVAHMMPTHSKSRCESHYFRVYLESPITPLPEMPEAPQTRYPCPVPFRATDDPPRPTDGTALQTELSGYMPARGDFTTEYDNYAEMDLRDIAFTSRDDPLHRELMLAAVDVYRNVVVERARRKRIIRDCELLNIQKNIVCSRRYELTIGSGTLDSLRVFQRLVKPDDWDIFLEGGHYACQLKQTVKRLQEYRRAGLTSLSSARVYSRLRARREQQHGRRQMLSDVLHHLEERTGCQTWLKKHTVLAKACKGEVNIPPAVRRAVPLDIVSLPSYEKLTDKERELCSTVRLVPEAYLDFKSILMMECRKFGCLRLAQARSMIKIDVNKTRKIYDFLLEEGLIYKDPIIKG